MPRFGSVLISCTIIKSRLLNSGNLTYEGAKIVASHKTRQNEYYEAILDESKIPKIDI